MPQGCCPGLVEVRNPRIGILQLEVVADTEEEDAEVDSVATLPEFGAGEDDDDDDDDDDDEEEEEEEEEEDVVAQGQRQLGQGPKSSWLGLGCLGTIECGLLVHTEEHKSTLQEPEVHSSLWVHHWA